MRIVAAMAALALLAGCDLGGNTDAGSGGAAASQEAAAVLATSGNAFDYRYAYRLPGSRVKAVQESNAAACDKLGPARCRILGMRYNASESNHITAILTFKIDPAIARAFGEAVNKSVAGADGQLVSTEIAGADSTAAARSNALVARLREQLANAESQAQGEGATADPARARAERIRQALDTIAEVEAGQGETLATAPVLVTYESNGSLLSLGSGDASIKGAGERLNQSAAQLLEILAGVGPWLLLMIVAVLGLRWLIHGRISAAPIEEDAPNAVPVHDNGDRRDNRNLIQRWFARDDEDEDQLEHH
ncbi:MAG: hypothetical protein ACOY45_07245 [Pseudomonadota bacterium]